jgi:hypothetical protein
MICLKLEFVVASSTFFSHGFYFCQGLNVGFVSVSGGEEFVTVGEALVDLIVGIVVVDEF